MSRKSDGLFKRLERLFRSGPIVKRKVKDIDTRVALANTDSSAVSLMQKSTSTTYTAITSRAYNVAERLMRYNDFVEMEQTPEIASALDIYADETCAQDEKGRSLHIYSDNTKIKQLLEELFYDTLNVEFNLRPWSRNLLKFGDLFLYNDVHPDHGVINVVPIPVNEIERVEGFSKEDPLAVKFRWGGLMNRDLENWEITHMRLLGNDTFLPYGSSIVEPARRIWRQLILIEDAMLIYRIVRAPDRRVFYIDVGNLEPSEVPNYIEQQRAQLRTNPVIDRANGRVDMKYNPMSTEEDFFIPTRGSETGTRIDSLPGGQNTAAVEDVNYIQKKLFAALKIPRAYLGYEDGLCLHGDTKIPLLNGTTITIKELADKFEDGSLKETWVYSTDLNGNVKPGRVVDAFKTKKVKKLFNITLDNGSVVRCTENHPFLCRNGVYKRADELSVGESLMPVYRKISSKESGDRLDGYEMVNDNGKWAYTHKIINEAHCNGVHTVGRQRVIHHADFNKRNNEPNNLIEMNWYSHRELHSKMLEHTLFRPDVIEKKEKMRLIGLASDHHRNQKSVQMTAQHADKNSAMSKWVHSDKLAELTRLRLSEAYEDEEYREKNAEMLRGLWKNPEVVAKLSGENHWSARKYSEYGIEFLIDFCKKHNVTTLNQWKKNYLNSVRELSPFGIRRVKTILKNNGYSSWKHFAHEKLNDNVECNEDENEDDGGVNVDTSKAIPNNHKIDHIGCELLENEEDVYDITVEYYSNFLIDAGVVVHNSSKSTLAFEDVRFSRTIAVIQRTIISELNKLAVIHLFANGFDGEDLLDFTLRLSNPSTVAQQQKLEIFRSKFEIAGTAPQGLVSKNYLLKNVLMLNDQEIKQINNEIKSELINDNELSNIGTGDISSDTGDDGIDQELSLPEDEPPTDDVSTEIPKEGNELLTVSTKAQKAAQKNDSSEIEKSFNIKMKKGENPIKPNHLAKHLSNRKRRRTHGPATTNIPDFKSMLSADNKALSDIYDYEWLSGFAKNSSAQVINPLGEGIDNEMDNLSEVIKPVLTRDMIKTMEMAAQRWGWTANNGPIQNNLIREDTNPNEFEIDFDELNNDDGDE